MSNTILAGIDIGATNIKYGLVNDKGETSFRTQVPTPKEGGADKLFKTILGCGEQLLIEADNQEKSVDYIGVGSPGSVDIVSGVIQGACPNIPGWVGFQLRDRLSDQLNLKVMVDNDANCAALAEHRYGAGRDYHNIICLTIGTGIGGGLIINDRIFRGSDFSAGEIGHLPIGENIIGGSSEILESQVSSRAIIAKVREKLEGNITPAFKALIGDDLSRLTIRRIFTAIKRGDKIAPEVVKSTAQILGVALTGLVNALNPEVIILGGGVAEGGSIFVDNVRESVMEKALPCATEKLAVLTAELGNAAGFIGAAILGFEEN